MVVIHPKLRKARKRWRICGIPDPQQTKKWSESGAIPFSLPYRLVCYQFWVTVSHQFLKNISTTVHFEKTVTFDHTVCLASPSYKYNITN